MIDVPALSEQEIERTLITRNGIAEADAKLIAHTANGSMTAALRAITSDTDESEYFDLFVSLMRLSYMRKVKEMKQWSEEVAALGRCIASTCCARTSSTISIGLTSTI